MQINLVQFDHEAIRQNISKILFLDKSSKNENFRLRSSCFEFACFE